MGYWGVVVGVWDSCVGYCAVVVGVWDSYVGHCGVVVGGSLGLLYGLLCCSG